MMFSLDEREILGYLERDRNVLLVQIDMNIQLRENKTSICTNWYKLILVVKKNKICILIRMTSLNLKPKSLVYANVI